MPEDLTMDDFARLEAFVRALRTKQLTADDLAALHHALVWQARVLGRTREALGRKAAQVQALEAENEALKQVVLDQDNPRPWDPDVRRW
jgi:hypothetical protein